MSILVVEDLGSGWVRVGESGDAMLGDEPDVAASVRAGVDVICFSGDKLLGGPQSGVIVGRGEHVRRIRRHPLMRALRVDKLTYAALEATLVDYLTGRASQTVPVRWMLTLDPSEIDRRARLVRERLPRGGVVHAEIIDGVSAVGGGSAPGVTLPTRLLALTWSGSADALEQRLRSADPPVITRIEKDRVLIDLRTVLPDDDPTLATILAEIASSPSRT